MNEVPSPFSFVEPPVNETAPCPLNEPTIVVGCNVTVPVNSLELDPVSDKEITVPRLALSSVVAN